MRRVEEKIAIVTGAGTGIGRAAALRLAQEGARVMLTDLDPVAAASAADEIGEAAASMAHDVRSEEDWKAVMEQTLDQFDGLDILINNAGILSVDERQDLESVDLDHWRAVQQVNVEGVFLGCQYAVATMRQTGGGAIVNLSSIAGLIGTPHLTAYGASKGAVRQLTKSVAIECARKGYHIRCNSVHPGIIDTRMGRQVLGLGGADLDQARETRRKLIPLGEFGRPEDIANGILFLASDESRHMTGAELVIDGGMTAI